MKQHFNNQADNPSTLEVMLLNKVITEKEYEELKKKQSQSLEDMMIHE